MEKKEELILLEKVKREIVSKGEILVKEDKYTIWISSDDWHDIFKTDEYNEMKNESLSKES